MDITCFQLYDHLPPISDKKCSWQLYTRGTGYVLVSLASQDSGENIN